MKSPRARLVAELDKLFSLYIRIRDKRIFGPHCAFGCGKEASQAFHFITRAKYSVRWDSRNAVASCGGCNIRYEHDQLFVDEVFTWFKNRYGESSWDALRHDAYRIAKFGIDDLRAQKADLKRRIEGACKTET